MNELAKISELLDMNLVWYDFDKDLVLDKNTGAVYSDLELVEALDELPGEDVEELLC
ncbi:MAG: hypothetical protein IJA18_07480 [Ruminococcus sp.]|nr:hypothetical protein [Ruminococcus sp.]